MQEQTRTFDPDLIEQLPEPAAVCEIIRSPEGRPADCRVLKVNQPLCTLLGIEPERVVEKTISELEPGEEELVVRLLAGASRSRNARFEIFSRLFERWFLFSAVSPQPDLFMAQLTDISAYKQTEARLEKTGQAVGRHFEVNEKLFRNLVTGAPIPVMVHTLDGEIILLNEEFTRLTGYTIQDIPTLADWASRGYRMEPEEALSFHWELARRSSSDGRSRPGEQVVFTRDGKQRVFSFRGTPPLQLLDGRRAMALMAIDLTERLYDMEKLEKEVRARTAVAEKRARQLRSLSLKLTQAEERERRNIARFLHDDLQQNLAAAKINLGLISDHYDPEVSDRVQEVTGILDHAMQSTRSLSRELSPPVLRKEGLIKTLEWLTCHMGENYMMVVELDAPEPDSEEDISVSKKVTLYLYPSVRELLFNVKKHAGTDRAVLTVRRRGKYAAITVSDQGRGFDPAKLKRSGEGLGLYSIRERLKLLGGNVEVTSRPGGGTSITLLAPMVRSRKSGGSSTAKGGTGEGTESADTKPAIRVLLADDHRVMRQGIAALIQGADGLEVVGEADSGKQVLEMADKLLPDVVVMDVSMPEMDGTTATMLLKQRMPQVSVVGLSMYQEEVIANAMHEAGACAFVHKGGPAAELIAAIKEAGAPGTVSAPGAAPVS
jgi:PAS domain S-box-containing protein